jgi:DNA-3-methyladenine glycosylase II
MMEAEIAAGIAYLRSRDPVLADVIERVGGFAVQPEPDLFKALVRAIIAQQISTGAARSIYKRVVILAGGEDGMLTGLAASTVEELRAAGVSQQKAKYLLDLASKISAGTVKLDRVPTLTNEEIIQELTQVKGIGVWTVQMLLIFSLRRLDVFPGGDLGIRTAIQRLYRKRALPTKPAQLKKFQKLWQPYASIASWYCWRSLELEEYKRRKARPKNQ